MSLILSNTGQWVTVHPPKGHDPSWQTSDIMRYAVLFQAAIDNGMLPQRAEQLAEAAVNRRLYPGLVYSHALEEDISSHMK